MPARCGHLKSVKTATPTPTAARNARDGGHLGAPSPVPGVRARRMLRQLEEQARHQAFQEDRASDHHLARAGEGWSWCYVDEIDMELG